MVTKEERERDRAICEAAAGLYVDGDRLWRGSQVVGEIDDTERDGPFLTAACERLPRYVAALNIHDAKLLDIETLLKNREDRAEEMERSGQHVSASILRDKALGLRDALHILRGEK